MSVILQNTGAGGTNGVAVTPANSGGTSGDAFTSVAISGSQTVTYDSATVRLNTFISFKVVSIGTSGTAYVAWSGLINATTQWRARVYVYLTALPTAELAFIWLSDATTAKATLGLLTTGKMVQRASGTAGTGNSGTIVIPLNQWIRMEFAGTVSATTGTMQSAMYSAESTTPLDSLSTTAQNTGSAALVNARFGNTSTNSSNGTYNMAGLALGDDSTTFFGPIAAPVVAPTLNGTVIGSDTFTGTDGAAPDTSKWTVTLGTGATALIGSNQAVLTPGTGTYSTATSGLYMSGVPGVDNVGGTWDLLVTVSPKNPTASQYVAIGMSTSGTLRSGDVLTGNGYGFSITPSLATFSVSRITAGSKVNLSGDLAFTLTQGTPLCMRFQKLANNTLNVWIWNSGTNMPTTPSWTGTDTAPVTGVHRPILSVSNGSSATPTPASFDNVSYATATQTQGFFIYSGTGWVHHVANARTATPAWVAAPASETT